MTDLTKRVASAFGWTFQDGRGSAILSCETPEFQMKVEYNRHDSDLILKLDDYKLPLVQRFQMDRENYEKDLPFTDPSRMIEGGLSMIAEELKTLFHEIYGRYPSADNPKVDFPNMWTCDAIISSIDAHRWAAYIAIIDAESEAMPF